MMWKINDTTATCKVVEMDGFASRPKEWLSEQMRTHKLTYLLAHSEVGVIWGRLDDKELITSHDAAPQYSPPLQVETLQMVRLFSRAGELLIWRNEDGEWWGRLIAEVTDPNTTTDEQASQPNTEPAQPASTGQWTGAFDEQQILLGTKKVRLDKGFYLMSEGSQELFHVVPLYPGEVDEQNRTLRLLVRHYLKADDYGVLRVNASRLLTLLPEPKESNT